MGHKKQSKQCSQCGKLKDFSAYGTNGKHGTHARCLSCRASNDRMRNGSPERRATDMNRRARRERVHGVVTADDIRAQLQRQQRRCFWCGCQLGDSYHIDHYMPFALAGTNTPDNIVASCATHNIQKGNHHPLIYMGMLASRGVVHPNYGRGQPYQPALFGEDGQDKQVAT